MSSSRRDDERSSRRGRDRSRSPKRDSDRNYSSRDHRDEKRKSSSATKKEEKEKEVKRGIGMAKDRLKSSLNAAIHDFTSREPGSSDAYPRHITSGNEYTPVDLTESVARQAAIERIEEPGFAPTSFKTDADTARMKRGLTSGNSKTAGKEAIADHERAMFGPMWASKEIEKKQAAAASNKQPNKKMTTAKTKEPAAIRAPHVDKVETSNKYPLAHESLSEDPEIRQQRWLNIWRERRKMALEGTL